MESRRAVAQLCRPGRNAPGDDGGKAMAAGAVGLGGLINADANPVGDGAGHGGALREEAI